MKKVSPEYQQVNTGHYSPGMISNGTLYVSGQLSIDPDTRKVAEGDVEDHARLALDNLDRVLKAAGVGREQVVQCRVYITDIDHWEAVNQVYASFFGSHKPSRCVVPVTSLHFGCLVEIEAVAELTGH